MSYPDERFISSDYHLPADGPAAMHFKFAFATLAVLIGNVFAEHIPPTTTAAELWNPWTWFWPYAIAAAEGYRDYFQKAQKATNELYQQAEKTNAFPWIVKPSAPQDNQGGSAQPGQGDSTQPGQGGSVQPGQGGSTQPGQGDSTQPGQGGSTQPGQGDSTQPGQGGSAQPGQGGSTQSGQGDNSVNEAPQEQNSGAGSGSPGVQVEGNTQDGGNADAGVGVNP